jgi:tRNA pseudouridine38-40 synthase
MDAAQEGGSSRFRYRLTLEYDGTPFCGWQWQKNGASVQDIVETALVRLTGHPVRLHVAGRTDAGVHATGQVAHVDLVKERPAGMVRDAANAFLRDRGVSVLAVEAVSEAFHARFSALRRHYRYRILNRRTPPALEALRVWHVPTPLDCEVMQQGAHFLLGYHDFSAFRSAHCQASSAMRTLEQLEIISTGEEITLLVAAKSFLHHQVRFMAGTLMRVGKGQLVPKDIEAILDARDRAKAGPLAPAHGLYLTQVDY